MTYEMPADLNEIIDGCDAGANIALFLTKNTGTCYGRFRGAIKAVDQRKLFGRFLGKGKIILDGKEEYYAHMVKVCFGTDAEATESGRWIDIVKKVA